MSEAYVGEVRLVGFNFAPVGWQLCNGQQLAIAQYDALFNLIGTTYGGDGQSNFNVPDLQGRIPIHMGSSGASNYVIGQQGGAEVVTITANQYPSHTHSFIASGASDGSVSTPGNNTVAGGAKVYDNVQPQNPMNSAMIGMSLGGNQPHDNLQPYLVLNWIISLYGVYPTPS